MFHSKKIGKGSCKRTVKVSNIHEIYPSQNLFGSARHLATRAIACHIADSRCFENSFNPTFSKSYRACSVNEFLLPRKSHDSGSMNDVKHDNGKHKIIESSFCVRSTLKRF